MAVRIEIASKPSFAAFSCVTALVAVRIEMIKRHGGLYNDVVTALVAVRIEIRGCSPAD